MLTICIILIVLLALDLLFTLALRCRKGHRKWEVLKKYRYAHRGYHDKPVVPKTLCPPSAGRSSAASARSWTCIF